MTKTIAVALALTLGCTTFALAKDDDDKIPEADMAKVTAALADLGCEDPEGCFNVISTNRDATGHYDPYTGSSFIMTAAFAGKGKPHGQALLSYSQSENPRSKHYADQTKLFSRKKWLPMRFSQKQIKADPQYSHSVVSGKR